MTDVNKQTLSPGRATSLKRGITEPTPEQVSDAIEVVTAAGHIVERADNHFFVLGCGVLTAGGLVWLAVDILERAAATPREEG